MAAGTSSEEGVGICFAICEHLLDTKVCVCVRERYVLFCTPSGTLTSSFTDQYIRM